MISVITPRIVIDQCARSSALRKDLLDATGISSDQIQQPLGRIPIGKMYALWDHAIRLTHDPWLPFHVAEKVPFGAYRLLDYLFAASSTPGEALRRSTQSFSVMNNALAVFYSLHRNMACLELCNPSDPTIPRSYVEYLFAIYLVRLRLTTQVDWNPAEIHVTYANPSAGNEYARMFRAPVRFHQAANRMFLPRDLTEMPQPLADPELCELLEHHAQKQLQDPSQKRSVLVQIQTTLANNLEAGDISLLFLARKLAKSGRNLQREIQAHGVTFRELLDKVRQERALSLLQESDRPIDEIAAKLQFASASAFCHAFHRWTGRSPREHRKHLHSLGN